MGAWYQRRSTFWGCRACKAARDEAAKEAREARMRIGKLRDWDDWKQEDSEPPQASLAHILSGSCAGNKEEARYFMRKLDKHAARATARVEREAPDSKDTATFLFTAWRVSHAEHTERRAERKEAGEDDSEEDEPVEIPLSAVTMHPKGTPAPASSVKAQVFEERVDLSNDMTGWQMIAVGVRRLVLARGELDRLEGGVRICSEE